MTINEIITNKSLCIKNVHSGDLTNSNIETSSIRYNPVVGSFIILDRYGTVIRELPLMNAISAKQGDVITLVDPNNGSRQDYIIVYRRYEIDQQTGEHKNIDIFLEPMSKSFDFFVNTEEITI